jgi:hypothetical protein
MVHAEAKGMDRDMVFAPRMDGVWDEGRVVRRRAVLWQEVVGVHTVKEQDDATHRVPGLPVLYHPGSFPQPLGNVGATIGD